MLKDASLACWALLNGQTGQLIDSREEITDGRVDKLPCKTALFWLKNDWNSGMKQKAVRKNPDEQIDFPVFTLPRWDESRRETPTNTALVFIASVAVFIIAAVVVINNDRLFLPQQPSSRSTTTTFTVNNKKKCHGQQQLPLR